MTPAEQAITLTENATSTGLPKWRWLPGMLDAVDGARLVTAAGSRYAWGRATHAHLSFAHLNEGHTRLPDFNDPTGATQGCLAVLLRDAWGPDVTISETTAHVYWAGAEARIMRTHLLITTGIGQPALHGDRGEVLYQIHASLAACRVRALAAAPS